MIVESVSFSPKKKQLFETLTRTHPRCLNFKLILRRAQKKTTTTTIITFDLLLLFMLAWLMWQQRQQNWCILMFIYLSN